MREESFREELEFTWLMCPVQGECLRLATGRSATKDRARKRVRERRGKLTSTVELDSGLKGDRLLDVLSLDSSVELLRGL